MKGRFLIVLLISLLAVSCEGWFNPDKKKTYDRVMILYSAGCNNLKFDLEEDISDLKQGYVPKKNDNKALFVVSHMAVGGDVDSSDPLTESYVVRLYKKGSVVVSDTLKRIEAGKFLTEPSVMNEALGFIFHSYKSKSYGMVFSSHATGWLPSGYYSNPVSKASNSNGQVSQAPRRLNVIPETDILESIGQEDAFLDGNKITYEILLPQFAPYIPMHLDYLIFDACFMGGVETAYELRNACDLLAFAPTEILSGGFNYKTLASHLLEDDQDVYNVCVDFYDQYKGSTSGTTVTLVNCKNMDRLADVCKDLFEKYRNELTMVNPRLVQPYFQFNKHWFYDIEDILDKAGVATSDMNTFKNALSDCIIYKAATPKFITITINTYSGFSMYLPCNGSAYLDDFYKTLAWNKATGLVQ